ncbi:MAG: hypothetical protein IIA75_09320 [Proteobacteria bacterium]|nr:hypothetical protein [Pseudomonadota bacterium]
MGDELFLAPPPRARAERCVDGKIVTSTDTATKGETVSVKIKGIISYHALGRANDGAVIVGSFSLGRRVAPHARSFYQINRVERTSPDVLKRQLADDFQIIDTTFGFGPGGAVTRVECRRCGYTTTRSG